LPLGIARPGISPIPFYPLYVCEVGKYVYNWVCMVYMYVVAITFECAEL
jgi:hypothetical protein